MATVHSFSSVKIDKDIPLPVRPMGAASAALKALAAAQIGDSVFIPMKTNNVPSISAQAGFKAGWYTSREEPGGRRVWKLAEPEVR